MRENDIDLRSYNVEVMRMLDICLKLAEEAVNAQYNSSQLNINKIGCDSLSKHYDERVVDIINEYHLERNHDNYKLGAKLTLELIKDTLPVLMNKNLDIIIDNLNKDYEEDV